MKVTSHHRNADQDEVLQRLKDKWVNRQISNVKSLCCFVSSLFRTLGIPVSSSLLIASFSRLHDCSWWKHRWIGLFLKLWNMWMESVEVRGEGKARRSDFHRSSAFTCTLSTFSTKDTRLGIELHFDPFFCGSLTFLRTKREELRCSRSQEGKHKPWCCKGKPRGREKVTDVL